jgi:molybdopterin-guanine dinucleotide biosynthesis protein A
VDILQTQERFKIPCVILAGGKSSRMGADKALLPFGEFSSLAKFQHNKLSKLFSTIYLSAKNNKFDFECNFLQDCDKENFSPLIAIKSAIEASESDKVFIMAVDYPFVSKQSIAKLIQNETGHEIIIARTTQNHNLCGIYTKKVLPKIDELISSNIHKMSYLISISDSMIIDFKDNDEFCNLNFKSQYDKIFSSD